MTLCLGVASACGLLLRDVQAGTVLWAADDVRVTRRQGAVFLPEGVIAINQETAYIQLYNYKGRKANFRCGIAEKPTTLVVCGQFLVVGTENGSLISWNLLTGDQVAHHRAHTRAVSALVASPDGRMVVSGSADGSVAVWCLAHLLSRIRADQVQPLAAFMEHTLAVTALAVEPLQTGEFFIGVASAGEDCAVKRYEVSLAGAVHGDTGSDEAPAARVVTTRVEAVPRALAFHPTGACLYAALENGAVEAVPATRTAVPAPANADDDGTAPASTAVVVGPFANYIAAARGDRVTVFSAGSGQPVATLAPPPLHAGGAVAALALLPSVPRAAPTDTERTRWTPARLAGPRLLGASFPRPIRKHAAEREPRGLAAGLETESKDAWRELTEAGLAFSAPAPLSEPVAQRPFGAAFVDELLLGARLEERPPDVEELAQLNRALIDRVARFAADACK